VAYFFGIDNENTLQNSAVPFLLLIRFYQTAISPFTRRFAAMNRAVRVMRLKPSRHTVCFTADFATKRILSCNPWGGSGMTRFLRKMQPQTLTKL
jgi:putative component of membrane protein insertase Oxa1/YidC/SpoIIIJ protein YidD